MNCHAVEGEVFVLKGDEEDRTFFVRSDSPTYSFEELCVFHDVERGAYAPLALKPRA